MSKNQPQSYADQEAASLQQAERRNELKGKNPNEEHNAKKVSLGPNTKR